ncbi:MAG: hypothetical protein JKY94_04745 [Rhodobacteraceae bacterium]|nr:hypothetical protein [Paracoccaceae bacterium]
MTATHEQMSMVMPDTPDIESLLPIKLTHGGTAAILTIVFRICGTAMVLTAPALWLLPGSTVSPDLMLMKFGVTLFFFLCGLVLLMRNHVDAQPEVYFDPIRREIRVLQMNNRGRPETILRRSYDTLGAAHITKRAVELWDVDGSILMRLSLPDAKSRQALRMHFSGVLRVSE